MHLVKFEKEDCEKRSFVRCSISRYILQYLYLQTMLSQPGVLLFLLTQQMARIMIKIHQNCDYYSRTASFELTPHKSKIRVLASLIALLTDSSAEQQQRCYPWGYYLSYPMDNIDRERARNLFNIQILCITVYVNILHTKHLSI